ncbi:MAG: hypothetical protein REI94_13345 [Moraxellaceae bacterium]|nr:hypothetical protein [Moraxellaceae bacterium]
MLFHIESATYCDNGMSPRWSWWLQGIARTQRFGILGTDEDGRGLYLFRHAGDREPERIRLLGPEAFAMPGGISKREACLRLVPVLQGLGWGNLGKVASEALCPRPTSLTA